jgi:hypothetical protein
MPVPEVFKIFSLHRYFMWSIEMREHYQQVGKHSSATPSLFDNEYAGRALMYLSYWYAGLYVVCCSCFLVGVRDAVPCLPESPTRAWKIDCARSDFPPAC